MINRSVTIVSNNNQTIDGVESYLTLFGARVSIATSLEDVPIEGAHTNALILFADDFARGDALATFERLQFAAPGMLLVVVTDSVQMYSASASRKGTRENLVVLQRPAWGWMLIDALRSGARSRRSQRTE
jgi:hypothetical protein